MGVETALMVAAYTVVGTTVASIDQNRKAAKRQQRAAEMTRNVQAGEDRIARTMSAREKAVREARVLQMAENSGTTGSSQSSGFLGSMQTLYAQQVGLQLGGQRSTAEIGSMEQSAANAMSKANTYKAIGNLATSLASGYAGTGG